MTPRPEAGAAAPPPPFAAAETNGLVRRPGFLLHAHSEDLDWGPLYVALITAVAYEAVLPAVVDPGFTFGLRGHGRVEGRLPGLRAAAAWRPGRIVLVPPGADCAFRREGGPVELCQVYVRRALLDRIVADAGDRDLAQVELLPRVAAVDPLLEQLALALKRALEDGSRERLYLECLALCIGRQLLRAHSSLAPSAPSRVRGLAPWRLRRVVDRLHARFEHGVTVEELAELAGLSPSHFAHAFKAATGEAPHRYHRRLRVEHAKAMLAADDLPLAEVALACGFASQSHFTTTFRDHVGVPPGRWREERRA
jgi:AraC family transcriptional regulator